MASSSMDIDAPAPKFVLDEFIAAALSGTPAELHPFFESFRTLYTRKLWHQLTLKLFEFLATPVSAPYRVDVFTRFVRDFEGRLNQLRLVEMGVKVAREIDNPQAHLGGKAEATERPPREGAEVEGAKVLLLATIGHAKLVYGDLEGTKGDMDKAWQVLDGLEGVDSQVNAAYYAKAEYAPYYRNSLLYLACVDPTTDMTPEERLARAHDLGISAFLGDTIYNFGELHWKFEALAPLFPQEPILQENYAFLRQKICLMALIESVSSRPSAGRANLTFPTIATETHLPLEEVEHLVMKALSLKLIRGSIDQVDGKVSVGWVQPRVLSTSQIATLADRIGEWTKGLEGVRGRVEVSV
ncbi:proteasome 26S subunit [Mucidula mucida]|nr:proteasome 26S subunit [Mucidula mucida]